MNEPIEPAVDDDVIDLRDEVLGGADAAADLAAKLGDHPEVQVEGDDVIIDLRELAPTGRRIAGDANTPGRSGRPPDLLPHHHLVTITGGDHWMKCEAFVYGIYLDLGYTEESSRNMVEELARFHDYSRFHAVVDDDDNVVGTIRAIFSDFAGLPVGKFTRVDFDDDGPMCELSSIVVDPKVRSIGIIEHLYREGWADATRSGCTAITGLGEKWLLDTFRDTYGLPFVPVGQPKYYMGGDVIPFIMSTGVEAVTEVCRSNPDYFDWNMEVFTPEELERFGFTHLVERPERILTDDAEPLAR